MHVVSSERETHVIINNIGYVHFACSEEELSCHAKMLTGFCL